VNLVVNLFIPQRPPRIHKDHNCVNLVVKTKIMTENEIAKIVFNCALKVHKALGPGLLESAYEECLYYELNKVGLKVEKQKPLPLIYENVKLEIGYRIDIMIENKFIVEIKAVDALNDVHLAQILTYLKLSDCKLGMLINFNVTLIKNGIKRVINGTL
jgi:GxxExxY protein